MYDLMELLYNYSASGKKTDRDFIENVMSFYKGFSKDYLKSVKYDHIDQNLGDPNKYCPMEYSYFDKEITIDEEIINDNFINMMRIFQIQGYSQFDSFMIYNSKILYYLLHEIDHSLQYKKAFENDDSFESSLLNLCFYPTIDIMEKSTLSLIFLAASKKLFNYSPTSKMMNSLMVLNNNFDRDVPYERLAQIDAIKQVLGLLEVFNTFAKDIPAVVSHFKKLSYMQYMVGYNQGLVAPLVRYIDAVKNLQVPKLTKLACNLESRFGELEMVDDRMKFGLDVSKRERENFKRRVLK